MSDVPPRDLLEAIARSLLSSKRLVSLVSTVLESAHREADAYESAIESAFSLARKEERLRKREEKRKRAILAFLEAEGVEGLLRSRRRLSGLAAYEALLERCQAVRYDDPSEMVKLASCATALAERIDPSSYGKKRVFDLQCRAWVELGNAYRVADRLVEAEQALVRAAQVFLKGTRDDLLEARMYDVQASLFNDSRRFKESFEALDTVEAIHRRRGDLHLAGRALISKGLYASYSGDSEQAVYFTAQGLSLIEQNRDPRLAYAGAHNLARALAGCERYREAMAVLFKIRGQAEEMGGRVNSLKVRWLEAEILFGLGKLNLAERLLLNVREGLEKAVLPYSAALAALQLALVYQERGQHDKTRSTALEALDRFVALKIPQEALMSVLMLRRAFEMGTAQGGALLRTVIEFLKRAEEDPTVKLEDWL